MLLEFKYIANKLGCQSLKERGNNYCLNMQKKHAFITYNKTFNKMMQQKKLHAIALLKCAQKSIKNALKNAL